MARRPSSFGFCPLGFHPRLKSSRMSWPRSPLSCIVLGSGSCAIWTTGSSLDPPFRRSCGRGTSCALLGAWGSSEPLQELPHAFSKVRLPSPLRAFPTPARMRALQHRFHVSRPQTSWDDSCLGDLRWWSDPYHLEVGVDLALLQQELLLFTDAVRLVVSRCLDLFNQSPGTPCGVLGCPTLPPFPPRPFRFLVHGQYDSSFLPPQGRGYSVFDSQLRGSGYPSPLRDNGMRLLAQFVPGCLNVRVDSLSRGSQVLGLEWALYECLFGAFPPLAGDCGSLRSLTQPSALGLLFTDGGSPGCGCRCDAPVLGSSPGLRLPAVRVHTEGSLQGSQLPQPGGHAPPVVPGSLGAPGGSASPSFSAQGSAPSAALPPFPSEPPIARADWVLHCQRSACHFGFSSRVARQLAFSLRPSALLNYQSNWNTYRAWCCSQGHSVSRPSIPKVADFLLYLWCWAYNKE